MRVLRSLFVVSVGNNNGQSNQNQNNDPTLIDNFIAIDWTRRKVGLNVVDETSCIWLLEMDLFVVERHKSDMCAEMMVYFLWVFCSKSEEIILQLANIKSGSRAREKTKKKHQNRVRDPLDRFKLEPWPLFFLWGHSILVCSLWLAICRSREAPLSLFIIRFVSHCKLIFANQQQDEPKRKLT